MGKLYLYLFYMLFLSKSHRLDGFVQENFQKVGSGDPRQSRPVGTDRGINTARKPPSAIGDASRLSWIRPDDVTAGSQSAAEADVDVLIDRYGRLNTGNLPVDADPRSDEVQQLIKV